MSAPAPLKISKQLALAERWAKERGSVVERGTAKVPGRPDETILILDPKTLPVIVRDSGKDITVFALYDVPLEIRKKFEQVDEKTRLEAWIRLRAEISRSPRTAYYFAPEKITSISELSRVALEQRIRISEEDLASYNRFGDAVQEIRTMITQAVVFLGYFGPPGGVTSAYTSPSPPPTGMFG